MIASKTSARPYAKALFKIAEKLGKLNDWGLILEQLTTIILNKELVGFINNPLVKLAQIEQLLIELINVPLNHEFKNLIHLLGDRKRLSVLPQILEEYNYLKNQHLKLLNVTCTSAVELDELQENHFQDVLSKRYQAKIRMNYKIDPQLLGGFVIEVNNQVIDHSVRGQLSQLKQSLAFNNSFPDEVKHL